MSAAGSVIWLAEPASRAILRVDAASVTVKRLAAPDGIAPIATAGGACGLWVADAGGDLALVDPSTAAPLGPLLHVGRSISNLVSSGSGVWVSDPLDGTVVHVVSVS